MLRRITLLLLSLLGPESCDVLLSGVVAGVLLFVDDVDHGPFPLVAFDPVIGEEGVVGIVDCHPCLILVRKQLSHIFWGGCPENLCEEKFIVGLDTVIGEGREHVLSVGTLWLNGRRTFWFNPVRSVVFMERIEQFLQPRHEFSRVFSWSVCEVSETIDDELVIGAGGEFLLEERANSGPCSLSSSEL